MKKVPRSSSHPSLQTLRTALTWLPPRAPGPHIHGFDLQPPHPRSQLTAVITLGGRDPREVQLRMRRDRQCRVMIRVRKIGRAHV